MDGYLTSDWFENFLENINTKVFSALKSSNENFAFLQHFVCYEDNTFSVSCVRFVWFPGRVFEMCSPRVDCVQIISQTSTRLGVGLPLTPNRCRFKQIRVPTTLLRFLAAYNFHFACGFSRFSKLQINGITPTPNFVDFGGFSIFLHLFRVALPKIRPAPPCTFFSLPFQIARALSAPVLLPHHFQLIIESFRVLPTVRYVWLTSQDSREGVRSNVNTKNTGNNETAFPWEWRSVFTFSRWSIVWWRFFGSFSKKILKIYFYVLDIKIVFVFPSFWMCSLGDK